MKEKTDDIDILEKFIKTNKFFKEEDGTLTMTITLGVKDTLDTAISNLISENKELKEENKKIKQEYMNPNKARISYFDYKKRTNVVIEGFIPKSKVEEQLRKAINNEIDLSKAMFEGDFINGYIFAMQSLLGKEKV